MIYPWKLNYWQSGEWQVANEKLKDIEKAGGTFNPRRSDLFASLRLLQPGEVKVCIIGQDPYPDPAFATGIPFSTPSGIGPDAFPRTLLNIFKEYMADLKYPLPTSGDLTGWVIQGVLLWNAIPTCRSGQSLSHDWPGEEWAPLTREIVEVLSGRGIVFCFLGSVAKRYLEYVDLTKNEVILTSHPSPRGTRFSKTPFEGSRLFSTINDKLISQGLDPIDWRLHVQDQRDQGNKEVLRTSGHVWNSKRSLSWTPGKTVGGVHNPGGFQVHE
jgi:uracil-DNA glycosylase